MPTPRDENRIPALLAVSSADGTPVTVYVNPTTHRLMVDVSVSDITALTGVIDAEAVEASDKGILVLGTDGSNYQVVAVDSSGNLQVDILNASIAVTGTFWQATQPISAASLPLPTGAATEATLVTIDADTGNIVTALQLIDDTVYAEDTIHATADKGIFMLGVTNEAANALAADTGDYAPIAVDSEGRTLIMPPAASVAIADATNNAPWQPYGRSGIQTSGLGFKTFPLMFNGTTWDRVRGNTTDGLLVHPTPSEVDLATAATSHVKKYYTSAGAATDGIIWSPAAGKRWYVTDIFIGVSAAATVTLEDDLAAGDSAVWKMELAANSSWSHSFTTPLYSGEDAADLIITTSAGNVYVTVVGYEI